MFSHAHSSETGATAVHWLQRERPPIDLIVSWENRTWGNDGFREKNDPGVARQTGKEIGLLARAQQSSHLEVAHGKRRFLQQTG